MKFIHEVIFDTDEFNNGNYNTSDWGDLTDGDYVVHCLYNCAAERTVLLNDNVHAPIEDAIYCYIQGARSTGAEIEVTKAYIVVDVGLNYDKEAITECLLYGCYTEVE